jgi:hypothetical protein
MKKVHKVNKKGKENVRYIRSVRERKMQYNSCTLDIAGHRLRSNNPDTAGSHQ